MRHRLRGAAATVAARRRQRQWLDGRDDGIVTAEFVAGAGLLVLPAAMLVAALPAWSAVDLMVRTAAEEAARAAVLVELDPEAAATAAAETVAANHGHDLRGVTVAYRTGEQVIAGAPGQTHLEVTVVAQVPVVPVPWLADVLAFDISRTHAEPYDLFRPVVEP